jgi:hypothetical protein
MPLETILEYALGCVALRIGMWLVYLAGATLASPYPLEFREGASQVMTQLLLDGKNPFSLANQPLGMNNYGIVHGVIVLPFAA